MRLRDMRLVVAFRQGLRGFHVRLPRLDGVLGGGDTGDGGLSLLQLEASCMISSHVRNADIVSTPGTSMRLLDELIYSQIVRKGMQTRKNVLHQDLGRQAGTHARTHGRAFFHCIVKDEQTNWAMLSSK